MIDLETICSTDSFRDYFYLRSSNPCISYDRYKSKIGKSLYNYELAFQILNQDADLN